MTKFVDLIPILSGRIVETCVGLPADQDYQTFSFFLSLPHCARVRWRHAFHVLIKLIRENCRHDMCCQCCNPLKNEVDEMHLSSGSPRLLDFCTPSARPLHPRTDIPIVALTCLLVCQTVTLV